MELLEVVRASWSFTGLDPASLIETNAFGNVLVESADGRVWRICPEELSCEPVAASPEELAQLRSSSDFEEDWQMTRLVELAHATLGPPAEGRCFCLKIPAVLGGAYAAENLATIALSELIAAAGDMALQIKDLPDGAVVSLEVVD